MWKNLLVLHLSFQTYTRLSKIKFCIFKTNISKYYIFIYYMLYGKHRNKQINKNEYIYIYYMYTNIYK